MIFKHIEPILYEPKARELLEKLRKSLLILEKRCDKAPSGTSKGPYRIFFDIHYRTMFLIQASKGCVNMPISE
jgi:hypothetical protein